VSQAFLLFGEAISPRRLEGVKEGEYLIVNETIYKNMDRLGENHPQQQVRELKKMLDSGREYVLLVQLKAPVKLWGIDFQKATSRRTLISSTRESGSISGYRPCIDAANGRRPADSHCYRGSISTI